MASLVLLNTISPSKALAVSEVLYLCEQHIDVVIIRADVEHGEMIEKQLRGIVMRLKPHADATAVQWELSHLFPASTSTIL